MTVKALKRAVKIAGGQSALAKLCGVRQPHIWNWLNRDNRVPAENALSVCKAVSWQVTPHELRPDIYPNPTDGLPADKAQGQAA